MPQIISSLDDPSKKWPPRRDASGQCAGRQHPAFRLDIAIEIALQRKQADAAAIVCVRAGPVVARDQAWVGHHTRRRFDLALWAMPALERPCSGPSHGSVPASALRPPNGKPAAAA